MAVIFSAVTGGVAAARLPAESAQLVVVTTPDWNAPEGRLFRFRRASRWWAPVGQPAAIVLGDAGLGWGQGLHPESVPAGPRKREGDQRSPAGLFALRTAFGRGKVSTKLRFIQTTPGLVCVDDPAAIKYNTFVQTVGRFVPWRSSEALYDIDVYDLAVVVEHNVPVRVAGDGSCIFLHRWSAPGQTTPGCTAMDKKTLATLVGWLDPAKTPVLVQLPRRVYDAVRAGWRLPRLPRRRP